MSQGKFREFIALAKQIISELRKMAQKLDSFRSEIQQFVHNAAIIPNQKQPSPQGEEDRTHYDKQHQKVSGAVVLEQAPSDSDPGVHSTGESEGHKQGRFEKAKGLIERFKPFIETLAYLAVIAYTIVTGYQSCKMKEANNLTQASLRISQRAYVTIGRKDGVVADFIVPKDPKQNAEIVIYFQNSGHLPAKFAWGTMAPYLASGSKKGSTGIVYTHPFNGGFGRTRDRKTGAIGEKGESTIIAGDSVLVSTLGSISQTDLAALPSNNMGLDIWGMYQYCDGLGSNVMRLFQLGYRSNAPSTSLSFWLISDMNSFQEPLPLLKGTTEYLPPCEGISEQEYQKTTR
jgi:hypothetical protein